MINVDQIPEYLASINERGFVEVRDAFDPSTIRNINAAIEEPFGRPNVAGQPGFIRSENVRFLSHALTWCRDIVDLYTAPPLVELATQYALGPVHLSNYRIYRAFPTTAVKMHWHVDNKVDRYDAATGRFSIEVVAEDKGLILILYLSDVESGGLQIVESSHTWSYKEDRESWDDRQAGFADKVVTFNNRPSGTAILYDYRCIHRAQPYRGGRIRTSLFGQYSPEWMPAGEPVYLNARDIGDMTDLQRRVLNFGQAPTTANWPIGTPGELFSFGEWVSMGAFLVRRKLRNLLKGEFTSIR